MKAGIVLDSGAFIALERRDPVMVHLARRLAIEATPLITSAGVVAQVWRGGIRAQVPVAFLLRRTQVMDLTQPVAKVLGRMLGAGGFAPGRDLAAITVNRWPHGYAPEHNSLWEPELPEAEEPQVIGRARFGRIAIANSDSGGGAYTDVAIDQAHRAVNDLLGRASGA